MNIIICPIVHNHHISYSIFVHGQVNPLYLDIFDEDKINSQKNIANVVNNLNENHYDVYIMINSENIKTWHNITLPSLPRLKMTAAIHNAVADDLLAGDNNYIYDKSQNIIAAVQNSVLIRIITQLNQIKQFKIKYILPLACILDENQGVIQHSKDKNIYSFKSNQDDGMKFSGFSLVVTQINLAAILAKYIEFIDINNLFIKDNEVWNKLSAKHMNKIAKLNLYSCADSFGNKDSNLSAFESFIPKPKWLTYLTAGFIIFHIISLNALVLHQESKIKQYNHDIKTMFNQVSKDPIQDAVLQLKKMQNKQDESLKKLDEISPVLIKYNDKIKDLKYNNGFWQVIFIQEPENNMFMREIKSYNLTARRQGEFWIFE